MGQSAAPLFLDRIDIQCEIQPVPFDQLSQGQPGESSAAIRERVVAARAIQADRFREAISYRALDHSTWGTTF